MCVNGVKTENNLIEHDITDYLKHTHLCTIFFNKSAPIQKGKEYIFN